MLPPLIDRTNEMAALERAFGAGAHGDPQLVILSGHRRVGKTFLLLHALESVVGQRTLFFNATQQSEPVELQRFAGELARSFPEEPLLADARLGSWERALQTVAGIAKRLPIVLVIDESPYLEKSTPGFASVVQSVWNELAATADPVRLTVVLTGSASTVMEAMVGADGPLRGRVNHHLRLRPFDLPTVADVWGMTGTATIEAFAACGGWPLHVTAWDPSSTTTANLQRLAFEPSGVLLADADLILSELPDGPGFQRVLTAVGRGRTTFGEIQTDADQRVEYPLQFLEETGLVQKERAVGAPRRSRPLYSIADPYVRFWFNVIYNNRAQIEGGGGAAVQQARRGQWERHVGWVFEEQARVHARRLAAAGAVDELTEIGRWWAGGKKSVEVDVIGRLGGRTILGGEVKWSAGAFDRRWISNLDRDLEFVPDVIDNPKRWVWTRARPPDDLPVGVRVFGPDDVASARPV